MTAPVIEQQRAKRTAKANVWTVPHGSGWANKREGAKRVTKVFPTKDAAQAAGRATAMREKVEHLILKRNGEIGERKSYGGDRNGPRPEHHRPTASQDVGVAGGSDHVSRSGGAHRARRVR